MLNCGLVFCFSCLLSCFYNFLFYIPLFLVSVLGSMSAEIKASLNNTYCGFRADENSKD